MPEFLIPGVLIAVAVLQVVMIVLLLVRRGTPPIDPKLDDLERRIREEIERLRSLVEQGQHNQATQNMKEFAEVRENMREELNIRLKDLNGSVSEIMLNARREQNERLDAARKAQDERLDRVEKAQREFGERFVGGMENQKTSLADLSTKMVQQQFDTAGALSKALAERLDVMRQDNTLALEKIRSTVDEKLQKTLEARLGEQFRTVSEQLDRVSKGLGEMQGLAQGVGDLKRVLTNVKSRGTFGEVQLGALLEQVLSPSQYQKNAKPNPATDAIVEYAIRLPGKDDDGGVVYLPIDAKFPIEDYERLQTALDEGDREALDRARRDLEKRLLLEAKSIREKYINPPQTTDFAILFLPTEGLYAEAIRMPGILDRLQSDHRVVISGPTTLYAILNSLQMGFRTLAIEKRSSEVWKILSAVKTEFGRFGDTLEKVQKKIDSASKEFDQVGVRSRAITRRLRDVQEMDDNTAAALLGDPATDDAEPGDSVK